MCKTLLSWSQPECPTVTVPPETAKAAFTKESNVFAELGVQYLCPLVNFADRACSATSCSKLGLSEEESRRAVDVAFDALLAYEADIQRRLREVLDRLEGENRVGIVVLARPYHHDPGLTHEILEEFQKLGYPVFSQRTLPMDADLLDRLSARRSAQGPSGLRWRSRTSGRTAIRPTPT